MWFSKQKGEWVTYYSQEEDIRRRVAGVGRPASRRRQYKKQLQARIATNKARRAALAAELGVPEDASFDEMMKKILDDAITAIKAHMTGSEQIDAYATAGSSPPNGCVA